MTATKPQVKAINAILATRGMMEDKKAIVSSLTDGRTERSSELTESEARVLLAALNANALPSVEELRKERMARKVLAMAYELGWIKRMNVVDGGKIIEKKDYSSLTQWLLKFSYLKKPLNEYTYLELPKLVTQFENGPYKAYLSK